MAHTNRPLGAVLRELPEVTNHLGAADLDDLLDPAQYTGAAGPLVDRALQHPAPVNTRRTQSSPPR